MTLQVDPDFTPKSTLRQLARSLLAYSCVNSTNTLASRARSYYGGGADAARARPPAAPPIALSAVGARR